MNKQENWVSSLKYIFTFSITTIISVIIGLIIFLIQNPSSLNHADNILPITILGKVLIIGTGLIWIYFLKNKYQNKNKKIKIKKLVIYSFLGLLISIISNLNMCPTNNVNSPIIWILNILSTVIIGPIIEEYLFRGLLIHNLKKTFSAINSVWISAIIFSVWHLNFSQSFFTLLVGLLLGYIMNKEENLFLTIIIHGLINLIGLFWPILCYYF